MFIFIDLLDHENKSHNSVKFEIQAQATKKELQDEISSKFNILNTEQRIFDKDFGHASFCDQRKVFDFFRSQGGSNKDTRYDIDLKELFVYKFLEDLKMGAEIHFIDNESFSKWIIYIGSREISGFKTLEFLELTKPQTLKENSKSVVEMLFVFSDLMLGDHHIANMGFDFALNHFIVDFFIMGKPLTGVIDLHERVRMAKKFNTTLGTFNERLKISTDNLKNLNFSAIFESSIDSFLQHQKPLFDKTRLVFDKLQKMDDLQEYVDNVRKNIRLFVDHSFDKQ